MSQAFSNTSARAALVIRTVAGIFRIRRITAAVRGRVAFGHGNSSAVVAVFSLLEVTQLRHTFSAQMHCQTASEAGAVVPIRLIDAKLATATAIRKAVAVLFWAARCRPLLLLHSKVDVITALDKCVVGVSANVTRFDDLVIPSPHAVALYQDETAELEGVVKVELVDVAFLLSKWSGTQKKRREQTKKFW